VRDNQKYIQLFGDVAIPLLGFFLWNWTLYFIILFYLLDYMGSEIISHVKSNRVVEFNHLKKAEWVKSGIISFVLLIAAIFLIHLGMKTIMPDINFQAEILKFWSLKDMGIEQGYFLLPLIGLVIYMRYKVEFVLPKKYKTTKVREIWKVHNQAHFVILSGAALLGTLAYFVVFPEIIYVLTLVLFAGAFQLIKKK